MADLESMLGESREVIDRLKLLRTEIFKQFEQMIRGEITQFQQTADHIVNLNLHDLLTELAGAELDCGEHFKRFPETVTRATEEAKEDWDRCYNRKSAAMGAVIKVALAYISVTRDVMDE
jgi:hypothetical protein